MAAPREWETMESLALFAALAFLAVLASGPIAIALALMNFRFWIVYLTSAAAMALGVWWLTIPTGVRFVGIVSIVYGGVAIIIAHVRRIYN